MIDVRELQRRGVVRIPEEEINIPSMSEDNEGFVDVIKTNFSSPQSSDNSRIESSRITELDNKIYKLENRIELLEKKLGVTDTGAPNPTPNLIGW